MRAIATRHGSSGRQSWATEIVALIDEGRYAQAGRLVEVLAECGPDAAHGTVAAARPATDRAAHHRAVRTTSGGRPPRGPRCTRCWPTPRPVRWRRPVAGADPGEPLAKWPLAIRAIGPFDVWVHGRTGAAVDVAASRATLRIIAVHRGRPVHREWLMDQLWPDAPAGAAGNSLNVAVHALRRALCCAHPEHAQLDYVSCRDGAYELAPGLATWVDVEQFDRHRAQGRAARRAGDKALAAAHFQAATEIYRGPLFEDDGADWHLEQRLALPGELLRHAGGARRATARPRPRRGREAGLPPPARDRPLLEGAVAQLMRSLAGARRVRPGGAPVRPMRHGARARARRHTGWPDEGPLRGG